MCMTVRFVGSFLIGIWRQRKRTDEKPSSHQLMQTFESQSIDQAVQPCLLHTIVVGDIHTIIMNFSVIFNSMHTRHYFMWFFVIYLKFYGMVRSQNGVFWLCTEHAYHQWWIVKTSCQLVKTEHYSDVIMGTIASQITSPTIVYSTVYSGADRRKHQSTASLACVRGIHWSLVNSPHKWPVMQKMFPFDDIIMIHLFSIDCIWG